MVICLILEAGTVIDLVNDNRRTGQSVSVQMIIMMRWSLDKRRHLKDTRSGARILHILVQVTIYRRLRIGRDGHLDQSEAYDIL